MKSTREEVQLANDQSFRLLRWREHPGAVELLQSPNQTLPWKGYGHRWHYHREVELAAVSHARGTRFIADSVDAVDGEDLVLIGANVPHYWNLQGPSQGTVLQWDFPRNHGVWGFAESAPLQALLERAKFGLNVRGATARQVRALLQDMPNVTGLARLSMFFKLLHVLCQAQGTDLSEVSKKPFSLQSTAPQQEAMSRAVSYLLANYRTPVRMGQLLELTHMSRATFTRQFQRHAGKPFSQFVNEIRIQAVCRALRENQAPIAVIALEEGFNQLSLFNRIFRRLMGCSPRDYRRLEHGPATPKEAAFDHPIRHGSSR
jgi:AraC-like DNA-binding protein